jgi:hypothetical protein
MASGFIFSVAIDKSKEFSLSQSPGKNWMMMILGAAVITTAMVFKWMVSFDYRSLTK